MLVGVPKLSRNLTSRFHDVRVEGLARAMRLHAEAPSGGGVEIFHYAEFAALLSRGGGAGS